MRSPWGLLSLLASLAACGAGPGDELPPDVDVDVGESGDGKADGALAGVVVPLVIEHGAVAGTAERPNLVAYLPPGLDPSAGLHVVVYLHGQMNCASNVVRAKNGACRPGYPARQAYALARQLDASGKNAVLLVPELAFDAADSGAFALAEPWRFAWLLWDATWALSERLGGAGYWDLDQVIVVAHSGGYRAAAAIATVGGVALRELWLLDGLYGLEAELESWLASEEDLLAASPRGRRFANVYTAWGGTAALSQAMAARQAALFPPAALLDDRTTATLAPAAYDRGLLFKRTGLGHEDVPRYYVQKLLETSSLPDRP